MTYAVKEIFYSLQGEGAHVGRPAVFCRFAGCNLWSGRESDRATAVCRFCDTDFVGTDGAGGGRFSDAAALADAIAAAWSSGSVTDRFVVLTGGEPLLQVDAALTQALHDRGFYIAVETNGTVALPDGLDWVCVSPKAGAPICVEQGQELKVVVPQAELDLQALERLPFQHFFVQPMDGPQRETHVRWAIDWCLHHPRWRLSLQTHKWVGIK